MRRDWLPQNAETLIDSAALHHLTKAMRVVSLPAVLTDSWVSSSEEGSMRSDGGRLRRAMGAHLRFVWRILRRCGLSDRDAEEATQDVFWILHRRMQDVPVKAERSFLASTALRVAADRRRSLATRPEAELPEEVPVGGVPQDELVALRRARALLDEALESLTDEQRAVFVLVEMEEMTGPEAADVLDIPPGTVASRLRVARQQFDASIRRLHLRERKEKRWTGS